MRNVLCDSTRTWVFNMASEYEERLDEANAAFNANPPNAVTQLVIATGDWLIQVTGEDEAVGEAMLTLLRELRAHSYPVGEDNPEQGWDPSEWKKRWEDEGWEIGHECARGFSIEQLMAFGRFGILIGSEQPSGREARIEAARTMIETMRAFYDAIPRAWFAATDHMTEELGYLEGFVLAAEGRLRLDTDQGVAADHIAALTELSIRSVRNLLLPSSSSGLKPDEDGLVPAKAARAWLADRDDYRQSIWLQHPDGSDDVPREEPDRLDSEVLFIPIASDGTVFAPKTCLRAGSYTIGAKGEEQRVEDYRKALAELSRMTRPAWRRPNPNGNWGIVRQHSWERRTAAELGLTARSPRSEGAEA